ncbi:MAG: GNAT family N-acetyltransferase [Pseudomonadota bacterium]
MNVGLHHPIENQLPVATTLEFRVFDNARSLLPIVPAWQALASQCENGYSFFGAPHWVMSWLAAFPKQKLLLVTAWRGGKMVLMAPMADCTTLSLVRQWCCATFPEAGYGGVLVSPNESSSNLMALLLDHMKEQHQTDIMVFPSVPDSAQWLPKLGHVVTPGAGAYAAMIDVRLGTGVANTKSGKRSIKRKRSKLAGDGTLTLQKIDDTHPLADSIIDTMIDWKIAWLDERALVGASVRSPGFRDFLKRLMSYRDGLRASKPFCLALCRNGEPVTASLFLPDAHILHCYFTAFAPADGEHSPGKLLIQDALEWMRDTQWTHYDFEGFPEPYKDKLATENVYLKDHAFAISWRGKLAVNFRRLRLRQRAKVLFYKLPPAIRNRLIKA